MASATRMTRMARVQVEARLVVAEAGIWSGT